MQLNYAEQWNESIAQRCVIALCPGLPEKEEEKNCDENAMIFSVLRKFKWGHKCKFNIPLNSHSTLQLASRFGTVEQMKKKLVECFKHGIIHMLSCLWLKWTSQEHYFIKHSGSNNSYNKLCPITFSRRYFTRYWNVRMPFMNKMRSKLHQFQFLIQFNTISGIFILPRLHFQVKKITRHFLSRFFKLV